MRAMAIFVISVSVAAGVCGCSDPGQGLAAGLKRESANEAEYRGDLQEAARLRNEADKAEREYRAYEAWKRAHNK
jgi:hypothetical protein